MTPSFTQGGSNGHQKSDNYGRRMSLKDALMSDEVIMKYILGTHLKCYKENNMSNTDAGL